MVPGDVSLKKSSKVMVSQQLLKDSRSTKLLLTLLGRRICFG